MRYAIIISLAVGVLLISIITGGNSIENVFDRCIFPLGMEEGKIPDDAITASSSYEAKSVGPQNARIRQEKNGGAWCPKAQISNTTREYLEIDLTKNHLITWTETQGRFGNGQGQEYAETFFLEYWRHPNWHHYKNLRGDKILRGNSNTYLVEKQKLDLPFVANRVRFVPYSQHPRTVCMRVEIYGCEWKQYVTSYSTVKGSSLGPGGWNVEDSSYDGVEINSLLVNGLGQLTDGILGHISEILSSPMDSLGTNWVGWSNPGATVQIIFHFQEVREFVDCFLHVARIPQLEVEIFSMLRIWFSIDGENYQSEAEKFELTSINTSSLNAEAISASITLRSRIGRLVKLEFSLAAKWLLLSEITFYTADKNRSNDSYISDDLSLRTNRDQNSNQNESEFDVKLSNSPNLILDYNETEMHGTHRDISTPDVFPVGTSQTYIGLISGLLTVFALFLTCVAFLFRQRGRNKIALLSTKHTAFLCESAPGIAIAPKDIKLSNSIVTGLSLIRKPIAIAVSDNLPNAMSQASIIGLDLDDPPRRSTLYESTYNLFAEQNIILTESNATARAAESSDIAADFKRNSSFASYSSKKPFNVRSEMNQTVHEGHYAATDILTINKRGLPSASSPFTPLRVREECVRLPCTTDLYKVQRISRHRLRILDKLGEGNFGLVHLCEAKEIINSEMEPTQNRQTVIVRSLWRGVVDSLRLDFMKDMQVLAMLQNSNVAKMIALVEEEPFGAVFEYGQYGDLLTFLQISGIEDEMSNYGTRVNFLIQIASGMRYLESMNIAHCDLAARNCIVDRNLTIKVSDHAVYCSKYDHHYFIDRHNAKIPLRWMSWEAILLNKHSCRADVWSFGVTVWEIFLNCKEMPYGDLTMEQILENYNRWYQTDEPTNDRSNGKRNQLPILPQPNHCSDHLYRMMNKCWSKRIEDRPSFDEICLYFEQL